MKVYYWTAKYNSIVLEGKDQASDMQELRDKIIYPKLDHQGLDQSLFRINIRLSK
jgi:hypothetical protein